MTTSGKKFGLQFADAVTVAPGRAFTKDPKTNVVTQHATIEITANQTAPSRVALAALTPAEARLVAAELIEQANAIGDAPVSPTLPSASSEHATHTDRAEHMTEQSGG